MKALDPNVSKYRYVFYGRKKETFHVGFQVEELIALDQYVGFMYIRQNFDFEGEVKVLQQIGKKWVPIELAI